MAHNLLGSGSGDFPNSEQDARNHIRAIRLDRGVDDVMGDLRGNVTTEDLQELLNVVAADLYQNPTRFIYELIQNADDNSYKPGVLPTVIITKGPGTLRLDCNERGFTKANVEAICRSGKSSKKGANKSAGYIGEKGIGFKSVFRVSKAVWIKSGHYRFKFNRDTPLGMVIPCWEPFPEQPLDHYNTSFLFHLSEDYNETELTKTLSQLDSRLLMFLRKLKRVEININTASTSLSTRVMTRREESKISRELSMDDQVTSYFVHHHHFTKLPVEERRPGASTSDITLAFPFNTAGGVTQPAPQEQPVYAFLPIRPYGLPFMIQADFVLVANREDINSSSWNTALLSATCNAFPRAIESLVKAHPSLQYSWVRFMPTGATEPTHLHNFQTNLFRVLSSAAILEARNGKLRVPSSLLFVPKQYRDPEGIPITFTKALGGLYLSPQYDDNDWKYLETLGVKELSKEQFLRHVKTCLKEKCSSSSAAMLDRHSPWHSKLAAILLRVATPEDLGDLALIPLRTGTWVTRAQPAFFLPGQQDGESAHEVPKGIQIPLVDPRASDDKDRRLLMVALGVKCFKEEDIARLVMQAHRSDGFQPDKLSPQDLVAHAEFIYRAQRMNTQLKDVDLWVATDDGRRLRASAVYLRKDPPTDGASKYLKATKNSSFGFAHNDYHVSFDSGSSDGYEWLNSQLGLSVWPRFLNPKYITWDTTPSTPDARKIIHPDFLGILDRQNSIEFLMLVKEGWTEYYQFQLDVPAWGKADKAKPLTAAQVVARYLRQFTVSCCGGNDSAPLCETTLPLPHLQSAVPWCTSFLDVPDPQDLGWGWLTHLGVKLVGDLGFYLQCLRYAKTGQVPFSKIPPIMMQIQAHAEQDITLLVDTMRDENLVCRPGPDSAPLWVSLSSCVWDAERWFRAVTGLRHFYPGCEVLFTRHLRAEQLNISHLIMELESIQNPDDVHFISAVLTLFKTLQCDGHHVVSGSDIRDCQSIAMFPVVTKGSGVKGKAQRDNQNKLVSLKDPDWFVADKGLQQIAFRGRLPILAFDVAKILELSPLFKLFGMDNRLLSNVAARTIDIDGDIVIKSELAMHYRSRGAFIQRLIPRESPSRARLVRQLQSLTVRFCKGISVLWSVDTGSGKVKSNGIEVFVVIKEEDKGEKLEILAVHGYGVDEPPIELAETLADHLGIKAYHRNLLFHALNISVSLDRLTAVFRTAGVPEYDGAWEYTIEGGYQGFNGKSHVTDGKLHLEIDLNSVKLVPFEPALTKDGAVPVSGGIMGIVLLFAGRDGGKQEALLSKNLLSKYKDAGNSLTMPVFRLKETFTGKALGREQLQGEKIMSTILEGILGHAYQPDCHWTSQYRANAGYAAYSPTDTTRASFTVPDSTGRIAHWLSHRGYKNAVQWTASRVIYHIEVKSTESGIDSPFPITNEEVERAMSRSHSRSTARVPEHVCIWVRMGNVKNPTGATVRFMVDPWHMWTIKELAIKSAGGFLGKV